jgi:glycosyltransferase involved in cell wall biosynthesis
MSQGLVPVTFPIGVAPEIITNGENGYIVNNVENMVKRIRYLLTKKARRRKMAQKAVKTSTLFKSDRVIEKYVNTYRQLRKNKNNIRH